MTHHVGLGALSAVSVRRSLWKTHGRETVATEAWADWIHGMSSLCGGRSRAWA